MSVTAREIVAIRKGLGLSRAEFAEKVGASGASVYKWERGFYKPGKKSLVRKLEKLKAKILFKSGGDGPTPLKVDTSPELDRIKNIIDVYSTLSLVGKRYVNSLLAPEEQASDHY